MNALKPFAPRALEAVEHTLTIPLRPLPLTRSRRRSGRVKLVALAAVLAFGAGLTALLHPDAGALGRTVQSTSSSALVQAGSLLRGLSTLTSLQAPPSN